MAGKDLALAVATATMDVAGGAYGVVGVGAVMNPVLRDLLRLQDEQVQSLRRIEKGVQLLVQGPWQTAKSYLEESQIPGLSAKRANALLRKAAEKLHDALGMQEPNSLARAYVAYDLAVVLALTDDKNQSRHYARMSADTATTAAINSILAERWARKSFRQEVEQILDGAQFKLWEVKASFRQAAEKLRGALGMRHTRGPAYGEAPKRVNQVRQQLISDWSHLVRAASILSKEDLYSIRYTRLEPYLNFA